MTKFAGRWFPRVFGGIALLFPVFFVPGLTSAATLPKIALLLIGTPTLLLLCLLRGHDTFTPFLRSALTWLTAVLPIVWILSAIFAAETSEAFFSITATAPRTTLVFGAFVLLFLLAREMGATRERQFLVRAVVLAPVLPVLLTSMGFWGVFPGLFVENGTVAGSFTAVTLLSAAGLVAALGALSSWKGSWRIGALGAVLVHLIFGVLAFAAPTWIAVSIGGVTVLAALLRRSAVDPKFEASMYAPAFIVGFALLFAFGIPSPLRFATPTTATPTFDASYQVTKGAITDRALLGYGPGQFDHAYTQYLPKEILTTPFWGIRFAAGSSELTTLGAEVGLLGKVFWLLLMSVLLWHVFRRGFSRTKQFREASVYLPATGLFVTTLAGQMTFFLSSLALSPLMWIAAGLLLPLEAAADTNDESAQGTDLPRQSQATGIFAAFATIALLAAVVFSTLQFAASAQAKAGDEALLMGQQEVAVAAYTKAVDIAPNTAAYWQRLADASLTRFLSEADKGQESADIELLRSLADSTHAASEKAVALLPETAAAWAQRARIHEELIPFGIEGAAIVALTSWDRAIELDGVHPGYLTERGALRLALLSLTGATGEDVISGVEAAREDFQRAVNLRPQYAPAHFHLALTAGAVGNTEEAIEATENALAADPQNIGYGLQLGLLYMDAERAADAANIFEQILGLDPNYANARYYLAILQARAGAAESALEHIDRLLEQNPQEQLLLQIRENITSGKDPLAGIEDIADGEELPEPIEP